MPTPARRRAARLATVAVLLLAMLVSIVGPATPAAAASTTVVISEFRPRGPLGGNDEFYELFNLSSSPVNIGGWTINGSSNAGATSVRLTIAANTILQPGQHFLAVNRTASTGYSGSVAGDNPTGLTTGVADDGGVALLNGAVVVDQVGMSAGSAYGEGTRLASFGSTNSDRSYRRVDECVDSDNNATDFAAVAPSTPQNLASPLAPCGAALPTVTVAATDAAAAEAGQDAGTFRVSRTGDTAAALAVSVSVGGTATANDDYTPALGATVEIAAGAAFADVTVTPVDDAAVEGAETVTLTATSGSGYAVGAPASATVTIADDDAAPVPCPADPSVKKISAIQGTGENAAFLGAATVEGVVTQISQDLGGFYMQEEAADQDADPATSEGIFVFASSSFATLTAGLAVGDVVRVGGTAQDRSTSGGTPSVTTLNTQIVGPLTVADCGVTAPATPVDVNFPLASAGDLERYEGMLVRFPQTLAISEYFNFDRFGEVVLSYADGTPGLGGRDRFYTPTNIVTPGAAASALSAEYAKRRITLDDGRTTQNPSPAIHPNGQSFTLVNRFRGGDTLTGVVGNVDNTFGLYRVQPTERGTYAVTNPRTPAPEPLSGGVRVAALNTLNFFLTLDPPASSSSGPCGGNQSQECRGANTDQPDEFTRQRTKLIEALKGINADVQGLIELENTPGVDPLGDPTRGVVPGLNAALGAGTYSYIDTGVIGTDAIRVGIIYKPAVVTPVGAFQILDSADDPRFLDTKNRPVLAQAFQENATGATFTVAVAHLKSKGSDCDDVGDPDTGDGQGNCNQTRTRAAQALVDWLDATFADKDFLIVGDLNSYAKEDPIAAILAGPDGVAGNADDYTNLIQRFIGDDAYSYVFDGQLGYLDHALASASLNAQAAGATEWHINADEPDLLDYDTSFKADNEDALYEPNAYRTSDHDPVLVGLTLTPPPAGVAPAITTQPQSQTITAGQTATLSVAATGTAPLHYQWYQGASGTTTTPVGTDSPSFTTPALNATTSYWVRVSNGVAPDADSNTATITVNQPGVAPSITTQPASQTITAGQTAALSVAASGTAPLAYQWYQGASGTTTTPVGTNSPSFTTPALNTTTSYWVRVSNAAGSADSDTATITVNAAPPADIVISQVYGGGGNSGAPYTHDFVELFNRGTTAVSLAGWSIQYASATGTGNFGATSTQLTELPSVTLQPGAYFLVQEASGSVGAALPTPDFTDTTPINMSGTGGKVALVDGTTSLGCNGGSAACDAAQLARIIDLVGWGAANFYEGAAAAPATTNTTAALRKGDGATDTNNNGADFTAGAPNPRNSSFGDEAPAITTQPASQAITAGQTATLSVVATGTAPLAYQWYQGTSGTTTTPVGTDSPSFTTPALSATTSYWVRVSNSVGSVDSNTATISVETPICEQTFTPIYAVQGSGASAAITGTVTVQGVVVGDFDGPTSSGLQGFYIQDPSGDGNAATSDGIFVYTGDATVVSAGQLVRVTGFARERFNQTTINGSNSNNAAVPAANIVVCGSGSVEPVDVELPFASATAPERYEGMLVRFPQALQITEYFNFDQFGEIVLGLPLDGEPRLFTPTAVEEPGAAALARAAANSLRRITLDDGRGVQNPDPARHPNGSPFDLSNRFRGGDQVRNAVGVLGYDFNLYRIQPTAPATYIQQNPRPAAPEAVGGSLKVSAFNTLNYFLTLDPLDDSSSNDNPIDNICGPASNKQDCRGADQSQPLEFSRQRAKLLAAIQGLDADVLGLNELENTPGVEPLLDIVDGLNAALGPGSYAYIDTGVVGTDAIRVGIIYKPGKVTPIGAYQVLDSADDPRFLDSKSRPVLAQTFEEVATGARFTVAVAHLKSKGSSCGDVGDPDAGDGQGNCNGTRTRAAQALVDWLATDPTGSNDPDYLIVGDLNSYAKEDPIDAILAGSDDTPGTGDDFTNLILQYQGAFAYSYVFDGQVGYLDQALASASMAPQVTGAADWHINADESDLLDYDTSFKQPAQEAIYAADAYRTSDHDPVQVGLDLNAAPAATPQSVTTAEDTAVAITLAGTDGNGDALTFTVVDQPDHGTLSGAGASRTYTPDANFNGGDSFTFTVSDGSLTSAPATVSITVTPVNDQPTIAALPGTALCLASGASGSFQVGVGDVEPGALAVTASSTNPLITAVVSGTTVTFSVASSKQAQSGTVTIAVSDTGGATASITASVWAGTGGAESRTGGAGIDVIFGQGGADTLRGGGGFDLICGGDGADSLYGDAGDDTLDGGAGSDTLRGGAGNDRLFGGDGADSLYGEGDNDTLTGGAGNDRFDGGPGTDTATDRANNETQVSVP